MPLISNIGVNEQAGGGSFVFSRIQHYKLHNGSICQVMVRSGYMMMMMILMMMMMTVSDKTFT